ncbi:MAG: hypothetical protein OEZ08_13280 [Betaproteobacteria bacterium]|nr:hypothetical protein [Betaproteobacteria bacterium]
MNAPARYAIQGVLYAAFAAFVGYFASAPTYEHLAPDEALVRLSFSHAAQRKEPCRERTAEELAKLAPNMRAKQVCPRARSPVTVEIELNGKPLYRIVAPPAGLSADGASTVYRRLVVPAGRHVVRARLSDNALGEFNYVAERTIDLAAGRVLLIDFNATAGGFVFKP